MSNEFQSIDYSLFTLPAQKLFELNVATFNAATRAQQEMVQNLISQAQDCTRAAMAIKDFDDLTVFLKDQSELAQANAQNIAESNQAIVTDTQAYITEVQSILTEGQAAVKSAVEPPMKAVVSTKKATQSAKSTH